MRNYIIFFMSNIWWANTLNYSTWNTQSNKAPHPKNFFNLKKNFLHFLQKKKQFFKRNIFCLLFAARTWDIQPNNTLSGNIFSIKRKSFLYFLKNDFPPSNKKLLILPWKKSPTLSTKTKFSKRKLSLIVTKKKSY